MTNETMKQIEKEIEDMLNDMESLSKDVYTYHHIIEWKIKLIERTLKSINYYRSLEYR